MSRKIALLTIFYIIMFVIAVISNITINRGLLFVTLLSFICFIIYLNKNRMNALTLALLFFSFGIIFCISHVLSGESFYLVSAGILYGLPGIMLLLVLPVGYRIKYRFLFNLSVSFGLFIVILGVLQINTKTQLILLTLFNIMVYVILNILTKRSNI